MPGALSRFNLSINGRIINEYGTNTPLNFTEYGDIYDGDDLRGITPTLTYPYRDVTGTIEGLHDGM